MKTYQVLYTMDGYPRLGTIKAKSEQDAIKLVNILLNGVYNYKVISAKEI